MTNGLLKKFCVPALAAACALTAVDSLAATNAVAADSLTVPMHKVSADGIGEEIGTIEISPKGDGIAFDVNVTGLGAGQRGFHLHENGSCEPGEKDGKKSAALMAGGHFDPEGTKAHKGPNGNGHKGDLPALTSTDKGVKAVVTVDHLSMEDVRGRALVIHEGGDNFSDTPANGGGGARIACGVIPKS